MTVAGVDIGNATTETALGRIDPGGEITFLASGIVDTTGLKGTRENLHGIFASVKQALDEAGLSLQDLGVININEAAPVIGDVAMEMITETIITESTIIGHNPATPGGMGFGVGFTIKVSDLGGAPSGESYIAVIDGDVEFEEAARFINAAVLRGASVAGAVAQKDDGVLIHNRLDVKIPIVDEVALIEKVPLGMPSAVEVAKPGAVVEILCNPYGVAKAFSLTPEETKKIVPVARALIGNRSAVVIKTPEGDVTARSIPAGSLTIMGERQNATVDVQGGANDIMKALEEASPVDDVRGRPGTNAGGMLERVRQTMSSLTGRRNAEIKIKDILAVDTFNPQKVTGGVAGEFSMESAVGLAAMVASDKLQMGLIAKELSQKLMIPCEVGGVEADMAIHGALTTPGVSRPVAIIDMGAGSTDASFMTADGKVRSVHLAGAGDMVTLLIKTELGIERTDLAEDIKKHPLARAESLFHIRHEDGSVEFFKEALPPETFARNIILKSGAFVPVPVEAHIEKIKRVRREAKHKVFVFNALRALKNVTLTGNIREVGFVVLVGGSALDFEIPQMVTDALSQFGVVAGSGNIRGTEGPRNAVATGLVLKFDRGQR